METCLVAYWSILENIPCACEKNVYFAVVGWSVLYSICLLDLVALQYIGSTWINHLRILNLSHLQPLFLLGEHIYKFWGIGSGHIHEAIIQHTTVTTWYWFKYLSTVSTLTTTDSEIERRVCNYNSMGQNITSKSHFEEFQICQNDGYYSTRIKWGFTYRTKELRLENFT